MRLGGDRGHFFTALTRTDRSPASTFIKPRAAAHAAAMEPAGGRSVNDAELGHAAFDEPDVDGIIVAAAHEFLGPVERIDEEICVRMGRDTAGCDFFFSDDRD